jgi:hypothetical protein
MMTTLIIFGVIGALIDIGLHILQMFKVNSAVLSSRVFASWVTLAGCILGLLSCVPQWNAGLFLINLFVGGLAVLALLTGKEIGHE